MFEIEQTANENDMNYLLSPANDISFQVPKAAADLHCELFTKAI